MRGVFVLVGLVGLLALASAAPTKSAPPKKTDVVIVVRDAITDKPKITTMLNKELPKPEPNAFNQTYPLLPGGQYYTIGDTYGVVPPNVMDPARKNPDGVSPDVVNFGQPPPDYHPMEVKTPLIDVKPCDQRRVLNVRVVSAVSEEGHAFPSLPATYGCSAEKDISREKASPSVFWSNFTAAEVSDFSLQMISMGDETCQGYGADSYNRIHWHVTGIKPKGDAMTLPVGASHDRRLLFGGREQPNQWLEDYYAGPCPPPGVTECFRFKVLAHLVGGQSCFCGHQDVLFTRPMNLMEDPVPWVYTPPTLAPPGKKQA